MSTNDDFARNMTCIVYSKYKSIKKDLIYRKGKVRTLNTIVHEQLLQIVVQICLVHRKMVKFLV